MTISPLPIYSLESNQNFQLFNTMPTSLTITIDPSCLAFWRIAFDEILKFLSCTWRWEWVEEDKVVFRAFFPAMKTDGITIDVKDKLLTITKELKIFESWFPKKGFETRRFCKISKGFCLPDGVKLLLGQGDFTTSIEEKEKGVDGVLTATVTFNRDNRLETVLNKTIGFLYARMYWELLDGKHVFKARLPQGMKKQDVNVEIVENNKELRIIKQLDVEEGVQLPDWLLREFNDGKICRNFNFPNGLDLTTTTNNSEIKIDDEMEDGVVTVTITFIGQPKKKKKKKKNSDKKLMYRLLRLLAKAAAPKPNLVAKVQRVLAKTTAPVRAWAGHGTLIPVR